jgi:hypothetical protein
MDRERVDDAVMAVREVESNGLRHGEPPVTVRVWVGPDAWCARSPTGDTGVRIRSPAICAVEARICPRVGSDSGWHVSSAAR